MSYTPVVTHATGDVFPATDWNLYIRDNISFLYAEVGTGGWSDISATLTYSTTDGHTFVCTTSADLTGSIPVGARIKVTHAAAIKYFIVTAIAAGTITLYGGTTYTLAAGAITLPAFARIKAPVGFPLSPALWSEELSDANDRSQASPVAGTLYNPGSLSLAIPIGVWRVEYFVTYGIVSGSGDNQTSVTLSTANNTESDSQFTCAQYGNVGGQHAWSLGSRAKILALAAKTSYFLNIKTPNASATSITFNGAAAPTIIRATCAYL